MERLWGEGQQDQREKKCREKKKEKKENCASNWSASGPVTFIFSYSLSGFFFLALPLIPVPSAGTGTKNAHSPRMQTWCQADIRGQVQAVGNVGWSPERGRCCKKYVQEVGRGRRRNGKEACFFPLLLLSFPLLLSLPPLFLVRSVYCFCCFVDVIRCLSSLCSFQTHPCIRPRIACFLTVTVH